MSDKPRLPLAPWRRRVLLKLLRMGGQPTTYRELMRVCGFRSPNATHLAVKGNDPVDNYAPGLIEHGCIAPHQEGGCNGHAAHGALIGRGWLLTLVGSTPADDRMTALTPLEGADLVKRLTKHVR